MARTTSDDVTTILGTVKSGVSLTAFITIANKVVTRYCTDASLTTEDLELIERYLAAHYYRLTYPKRISETAGDVSQSMQHVEDLGFDATEFGRTAKQLDSSGALAALDRAAGSGLRRSVSLIWAGVTNSEAISL